MEISFEHSKAFLTTLLGRILNNFTIREVFRIGKNTLEGKNEQLDFKNLAFLKFWEYAKIKNIKMELKYQSFMEIQ